MKKKGQASLEYLTTYGWALLVLGIVFAALYLFMEFKPDRLVPETCSFGDSFTCNEFKMNGTSGRINVSVVNVVGTSITLDSMICEYQGTNYQEKVPDDAKDIAPGAEFTVACNVSGSGESLKRKSKVDLTIVYYKVGEGSVFPLSSDGFVSGSVLK
jgi:hypothetical protein